MRDYRYYAVTSLGYRNITLFSDNPMVDGQIEFKRKYGAEGFEFCSLVNKENTAVAGKPIFNIPTKLQFDLYQQLIYGWGNVDGYSTIIFEICKINNIPISVEHIKYIYINNMARKFRYTDNLKLHFVIISLIDFLDLLSNTTKQTELNNYLNKFRK